MRAALVLALLAAVATAEEATILAHDIVLRIDPATGSFVSHDTVTVRGPGLLRVPVPDDRSYRVEVSGGNVDVPAGVHELRVRFSGRRIWRKITLPVEDAADLPGILEDEFFVPASHPSRFTLTIGVSPTRRAVAPGHRLDEWKADGLRFVTYAGHLSSDRLQVWHGRWETDEARVHGTSCRIYHDAHHRERAADMLETLRADLARFHEMFGPLPGGRFDVLGAGLGELLVYTVFGTSLDVCDGTERIDHALAHAWFGNLVRVDPARGDWSEGLAAYFGAYGAAERAGEDAAYRARLARGYSLRVREDAESALRTFHGDRPADQNAIGAGKESMVFHMLARELGRERFLDAVRHALKNYAGDTFGWDGWVTVLSENAGRDLAPWFAPWLDRPGAPVLEIGTLKVKGRVVAGTIRQTQPGAAYPLRIPVRVTTAAGREEHLVLSASKETAFSLTTKGPPRLVEVDPDHHIFRRIPRDRVAPCLDAVLTASKRVGYGDAETLRDFGIERVVGQPPADAAILALELPAGIKESLLRDARQQDASLRIETGRFTFRGKVHDDPHDGLLFSFRAPGRPPVTLVHGNARVFALPRHRISLKDYGLDSWVLFRNGQPVARGVHRFTDRAVRAEVTPARTGEVEPLVRDLLFLTDPRHLGREAGTMAAYKLANELRGRMHNLGLKVLPWPSVRIPRGSVSGRELVILDGDEKVRLEDAFFPFHESASPRHAPVFARVVEHPAGAGDDVEEALVLLPEDASRDLATQYAQKGAAAVAVVAADEALSARGAEAAWEGALPPALAERYPADRFNRAAVVAGLLAHAQGGEVLTVPYLYLRPAAARELRRRSARGVLHYEIRRRVEETSNLIGVLGNPRRQGVLLCAHWDGVGRIGGRPAQAASDNAAGVAVVLWVAARLERDFEAGKLKRPVVVALLGGNETGLAGSRQLVAALESPRCPIARPLQAVNVEGVGSLGAHRVHLLGSADPPELLEAFNAARKSSGLVLGRDPEPRAPFDHRPLQRAGIPAVTVFSADPRAMDGPLDTVDLVDVDTMRRVARVVYRMVRDLASQ